MLLSNSFTWNTAKVRSRLCLPVKTHKSTEEKLSTKYRAELQIIGFTKDDIRKMKHDCSFRDNTIASYVSQFYF